MKKTIFLMISIFVIQSCGRGANLASIEDEFSIVLPQEFEVLEFEEESYGEIESDYSYKILLQFKNEDFDSIIIQIENSIYFNELHEYYGNSIRTQSESDTKYVQILDSLKRKGVSGTWIEIGARIEYLDFFNWREFWEGAIDKRNRTACFRRHHL